ncbi:hypothetical protein V3F56_03625 [Moorellaceae bacterium AZ2]
MAQFRSPFSAAWKYELKLTEVNPGWAGIRQAYTWSTERDAQMLWLVTICRVLTRSQLAKLFWPNNPDTGTKRLRRMARMGVLVPHVLKSPAITVHFYTLGPIGCQILKAPYTPNWWMDLDLMSVLKMLAVAQLYLRFYRISQDATMFPAPLPYDAVISFKNLEFAVLALRDGTLPPIEKIKEFAAQRLLVIAEKEETIKQLAPHIQVPARYITDEHLFQKPLHEAFCIWDTQESVLRQEYIPAFREEVPVRNSAG